MKTANNPNKMPRIDLELTVLEFTVLEFTVLKLIRQPQLYKVVVFKTAV